MFTAILFFFLNGAGLHDGTSSTLMISEVIR
jgi:hypothetical protein